MLAEPQLSKYLRTYLTCIGSNRVVQGRSDSEEFKEEKLKEILVFDVTLLLPDLLLFIIISIPAQENDPGIHSEPRE